jgi:hypothetical protein
MQVHFTKSEVAAPKRMAAHEDYAPTKWVVAMVRTKLTRESHLGQAELEGLERSNH